MRSQRESLQRFIDRHGLTIHRWYEDEGFSRGAAYARPAFQDMLKAVQNGEIDFILCDTQDRFGTRSSFEFGKYATLLQDHDCQLWSVLEGHLTADDEMAEVLGMVGGLRSRNEITNKAERSIRDKITRCKAGSWCGGFVPLGFDVAVFGPDDVERWRVVILRMEPKAGIFQRLKVFPDGREERWDGSGNFPPKAVDETYRLAPSCRKERVECVQRIFEWFANETLSLRALCRRLNDLKVDPVIGTCFYVTRLKPMLENPLYHVGQIVWNKNSHGKALSFVNGEYQRVKRVRGKVPTGRKNSESDYIFPQGEFQGLITKELFDRVQVKLKGIKSVARSPKNSDLYLSGKLVCGHCKKLLVGWHQKSDRACPLSYTCPSYRLGGRNNKAGCRLHRTNHRVIEGLIRRFLDDAGQGLEGLVGASGGADADEIIEGLLAQRDGKQWEYIRELTRLWREVKDRAKPPTGEAWSFRSLCREYRSIGGVSAASLREELNAKDAEHTRLVEQFANLTSELSRQKANRRLQAIEDEIGALQGRLKPLDASVQSLRIQLKDAESSIAAARAAFAGSTNRRKADVVGRAISRVECFYRYSRAGVQERSTLERVVIVPVVGEARHFAASSQPGRG